jgi:regulator of replication initiation timing
MKKRNFSLLVCVVMLFSTIVLTACTNETDALQAQIDSLVVENSELQSIISSLRTDLERAQADLTNTRNELQHVQAAYEAAVAANEQTADDNQTGPLAITYAGEANQDMSWPLNFGDLPLSLRVNLNEFEEDVEIIWHSTNDEVFIVIASEDGLSATVTPLAVGSAQLVVNVGDQETRSWVRIT